MLVLFGATLALMALFATVAWYSLSGIIDTQLDIEWEDEDIED